MARIRTVSPSDEDLAGIGLSEEEIERKAAGDIALLDDPIFNAYKWSIWRLRTAEEVAREPQGGEWEHVSTKIGQIDEDWARANLGGGTFEFRGYYDAQDGNGRTMKRRPIIPIAGPRKNFAAVQAPVVSPTATPSHNGSLTRGERIMLRMFKRMDDRLAQLTTLTAPVQPPPTLKDMAETLTLLNNLHPRQDAAPTNPDKEVVGAMIEMVSKGIELGQSRDPVSVVERSGTDWAEVFKLGMPLVDRMLTRVPMRRPMPPRPAGDPIESAPSPGAAETQPESGMNYRWPTAIEALANAIADGEDPTEFAITLEHILNKQEFGMLRQATVDLVMGEVGVAVDSYPILKTPQARTFIEALLAEIKNPTPPDSQ